MWCLFLCAMLVVFVCVVMFCVYCECAVLNLNI